MTEIETKPPQEVQQEIHEEVSEPKAVQPVEATVTFVAEPYHSVTQEVIDAQNDESFETDGEPEMETDVELEPADGEPAPDPEAEARALAEALPNRDAEGAFDLAELESCIESLLFMSEKPLSSQKLHEMLGPDAPLSVFQEAITGLRDRYRATHHGIEIVEVAGGYQMRTKPGRAALAKKLAKTQTQKLSTGAMESLAIIAYKQPVMKEDIDQIRGVDSSYFIRALLEKKLIRISGRSELPGRPLLYSTTEMFLERFSLKDLSAMPSLRELEQMVPASEVGRAPDEETPAVRELRRMVGGMNADTSVTLKYDPREDDQILREIRERVSEIAVSTPYLEEQRALEKALAEAQAAAEPEAEPRVVEPAAAEPLAE